MNGFKKFILRGNVVDLAVGFVIGAAFASVVKSLVDGVITPLTTLFGTSSLDRLSVCLKGVCGSTANGDPVGPLLRYGLVLSALVNFLIIAAIVYFLVVRPVQSLLDRFKTEPEVTTATKECPECLSSIPAAAARCAFCTVEQLDVVEPAES